MPGFNGTGPEGMGPKTGRGMGNCGVGRGLGRSVGRRLFGRGRRARNFSFRGRLSDMDSLVAEEKRLEEELEGIKKERESLENNK